MVLSVRVTKSLSASASLICTCDLVLNIIISPPLENCQQCVCGHRTGPLPGSRCATWRSVAVRGKHEWVFEWVEPKAQNARAKRSKKSEKLLATWKRAEIFENVDS